jgi:glycosyltransferase involved in cell wall biosynthesis
MNILFICDEYPPGQTGGIGVVVQSLSRALVAQGHHVCVAGLYKLDFGAEDYEVDNGVQVWRLRYQKNWPGTDFSSKVHRNLPLFIQKRTASYRAHQHFVDFVQQLVEKEKIDIVEMPDWVNAIYDMGINLPFPKLKVPLVVKFHGSRSFFDFEMNRPLRKKWLRIDKAIYDRADALSATSNYAATINAQLFGGNRKINILYNAIDMPLPGIEPIKRDHFTVVFAGTLIEKKGIFSLMKAWNMVAQKEKRARLWVLGKGETEPLKQLLEEQVQDSVIFKGHQAKPIVLESFAKATMAVFPSYSETFGLVAIEAMSMECPTIFTSRASGKELIEDGVSGFLVDPDHIQEMADKILTLLGNTALQKQVGAAGRIRIKDNFDIQISTREHLAFYTQVIADYQ